MQKYENTTISKIMEEINIKYFFCQIFKDLMFGHLNKFMLYMIL